MTNSQDDIGQIDSPDWAKACGVQEKPPTSWATGEAIGTLDFKIQSDARGALSMAGVNWTEIETEYREARDLIDGVQFPSADQVDCFKASIAAPHLVSSDLPKRFRWADRYPPLQGKDRSWMLEQILGILGRNGQSVVPKHIRPEIRGDMTVVDRAIADRSLSLEFLYSWGKMQMAVGGLIALLIGDGAAERHFVRGMQAAVKGGDAILQRYWYAHWMVQHGLFKGETARADLNAELAELCEDIKRKGRRPRVHNSEWFGFMIEDEGLLKTRFTRCAKNEIERMVNNPLIPKSALPPLSVEEFPPMRRRTLKVGNAPS